MKIEYCYYELKGDGEFNIYDDIRNKLVNMGIPKEEIAFIHEADTDKQKELSAVMGIQSLPTIIFIPKTGQPQIIIGAANKATFRKAIEEVLLKE